MTSLGREIPPLPRLRIPYPVSRNSTYQRSVKKKSPFGLVRYEKSRSGERKVPVADLDLEGGTYLDETPGRGRRYQ